MFLTKITVIKITFITLHSVVWRESSTCGGASAPGEGFRAGEDSLWQSPDKQLRHHLCG